MTRATVLSIRHDSAFAVSLEDVVAVADGRLQLELAGPTRDELQKRRDHVVSFVKASKTSHYGFNRGFGHNQSLGVPEGWWDKLQYNLILSHSCGVGDALPDREVRAAMFLRALSLARGNSGVRPEIIERLLNMINEDIVPIVPRFGSVGASGDLAPLSHVALAMIGEGPATWRGQQHEESSRIFQELGWPPLRLEMKEGLALNNGVQVTTAVGLLALRQMQILLENAVLATSISAQVMLGADTPFRPDLHELRPHPGAKLVANWIWQLMSDSPIRESHRRIADDGEVQDPYNLRCAAQVLGACAELLEDARSTLEIEANSVTDNPVILPATEEKRHNFEWGLLPEAERDLAIRDGHFIEILSGGHFHGMPVAVKLYGLIEAMGIIARLSNMRVVRYIDEKRSKGLLGDLKWPGLTPPEQAISSAMMIPEYVSAALTNWIWGAAMPTHIFSLSTDAGQEDHVSMGPGIALRLMDTAPRLAEVLAIELAMAAQAAAIRREQAQLFRADDGPRKDWTFADRLLSPPGEAVLAKIGEDFRAVTQDRPLSADLQKLAASVLRGEFVSVASRTLSGQPEHMHAAFPSWTNRESASASRYTNDGIVASYLEAEWGDFFDPVSAAGAQPVFAHRVARRIANCLSTARPPETVLDAGGATGRLLRELRLFIPSVREMTLLEPSPVFCDLAKRFLLGGEGRNRTVPAVGVSERPHSQTVTRWPEPLPSGLLSIRNTTVENAEITASSQDVVACLNVVDRHTSPSSLLENLTAWLRPGGILVLATPFDWSRTYTPDWNWVSDLRELLPASAVVLDIWDEEYDFRYHQRHTARFSTQVLVAQIKK